MKIAARPNREGLLEFHTDASLFFSGERITPIDVLIMRLNRFLLKKKKTRSIKKLVKNGVMATSNESWK